MKKYIFEVTINEDHKVLAQGDTRSEAEKDGVKFYKENNYFLNDKVYSIGSKLIVNLTKVINLPK